VTVRDSVALVVDCRAVLGEGLTWDAADAAWLWTDIQQKALWRYHPATGDSRCVDMPDRVGAFAVARSGRLLVAFSHSLAWAAVDWRLLSVQVEHIVSFETEHAALRSNDGRTDADGHFVFGTMNEAAGHAPLGGIFQYSSRFGLRRLNLAPVGIANSICFSPDGSTLYYCDSTRREIRAADYDAARARVTGERRVVQLGETDGLPDGSVVDASGRLWNAQWGRGLVRCYTPDGEQIAAWQLPVDHVTCPCFGGAAATDLLVTTARMDVSDARLKAVVEAGGVFRLDDHDARGIVSTPFPD
jgi:L-arabinonolactonase